ncbi:uncharacterized protein TA07300 [Theileria annulata]|uniref:C3H1-type domain-containing protein n=1 Tax=Theileria annulata TaxID=5874 RepID=Q4UA85_THEAN|nr:uncharacterized protein TA07300 [Theileria annulata]CAI76268.1 hypothetical protein TA07300 [Theileria annulata]|eukprot:XP_952892.1 hypothetical protein TA07300 [Theileria annulata]
MDYGILLKLPLDWQVKIRDEMVSKLSLCIEKDHARTVAEETWEYLSQEKFNKKQLTNKLENYLNKHASDFTEWLQDFVQKTVEYYNETHLPSNAKKENLNECNEHTQNNKDNEKKEKVEKLKESRSRIMKNALKDIHNVTSDSGEGSKANNDGAVVNETECKSDAVDGKKKLLDPAEKKTKLLDALDQPLDKLILKEKIAKLQGQSVPLGVKTKSEKFKPSEKFNANENFNAKRKKSVFYKNLTLVNDSSGSSESVETAVNGEEEGVKVVKVPKRCINYPKCEFGEKCRYIHPNNVMCKNWPNCFFGNNCAFLHPSQ